MLGVQEKSRGGVKPQMSVPMSSVVARAVFAVRSVDFEPTEEAICADADQMLRQTAR